MPPSDEELVRRRLDLYEQWWERERPGEGEMAPEAIDDLWAMCRKAWYAGREAMRAELWAKEDPH